MLKKATYVGILVLHLAIVGYFWARGSWFEFTSSDPANVWIAVGRICGLLLVTAVLNQLIMISRIKFLEQTFGHDKLSRLHHWTGYGITVLLIGHVLSILIGYGLASGTDITSQFVSFLGMGDTFQAALAFTLLLVVIGLSIFIVVTKMKYEWWYLPHLATYLAVLFAFSHQIEMGGDLQQRVFGGYWITMYVCVALLVGWNRFAKPLLAFLRQRFTVASLHPENDSVTSIYIKGNEIGALNQHAGQFFIFRFLQKGMWWQAHPFSLSYAPHTDAIRISTKAVGDFTQKMHKDLKPGTKVLIEGPFGIFGRDARQKEKTLLIAGGIGITPIRSVFETLTNKDAILVYVCKSEKDFVLKNELEEIAQRNGTKVIYDIGPLENTRILELVPDAKERAWYVCTPIRLMKKLHAFARELGVKEREFNWERFTL